MSDIAVFDLDGTLALIDHRRHFVEGDNKDWKSFFKACPLDHPNLPVIDMAQTLSELGFYIYIVSGRSEDVMEETIHWLDFHQIPRSLLFMRPSGDFRPDDELKKEWLGSLSEGERRAIRYIFDDRNKVVKMWRAEGLPCFQVADGDF